MAISSRKIDININAKANVAGAVRELEKLVKGVGEKGFEKARADALRFNNMFRAGVKGNAAAAKKANQEISESSKRLLRSLNQYSNPAINLGQWATRFSSDFKKEGKQLGMTRQIAQRVFLEEFKKSIGSTKDLTQLTEFRALLSQAGAKNSRLRNSGVFTKELGKELLQILAFREDVVRGFNRAAPMPAAVQRVVATGRATFNQGAIGSNWLPSNGAGMTGYDAKYESMRQKYAAQEAAAAEKEMRAAEKMLAAANKMSMQRGSLQNTYGRLSENWLPGSGTGQRAANAAWYAAQDRAAQARVVRENAIQEKLSNAQIAKAERAARAEEARQERAAARAQALADRQLRNAERLAERQRRESEREAARRERANRGGGGGFGGGYGMGNMNPGMIAAFTRQFTNLTHTLFQLQYGLYTLGTFAMLEPIVRYADMWQRVGDRISLVVDKTVNIKNLRKELNLLASETYADFDSTAALFTKIMPAISKMGYADPIQAAKNTVAATNLGGRLSGSSAEATNAAIIQLTQAIQSNRFGGDELRSVAEQTPATLRYMIANMEKVGGQTVTMENFRDLSKKGLINAQVVIRALEKALPQMQKDAARLTPTISDAFLRSKNALMEYVGTLNDAMGATRGLARMVSNYVMDEKGALSQNFKNDLDTALMAATSLIVAWFARLPLKMIAGAAIAGGGLLGSAGGVAKGAGKVALGALGGGGAMAKGGFAAMLAAAVGFATRLLKIVGSLNVFFLVAFAAVQKLVGSFRDFAQFGAYFQVYVAEPIGQFFDDLAKTPWIKSILDGAKALYRDLIPSFKDIWVFFATFGTQISGLFDRIWSTILMGFRMMVAQIGGVLSGEGFGKLLTGGLKVLRGDLTGLQDIAQGGIASANSETANRYMRAYGYIPNEYNDQGQIVGWGDPRLQKREDQRFDTVAAAGRDYDERGQRANRKYWWGRIKDMMNQPRGTGNMYDTPFGDGEGGGPSGKELREIEKAQKRLNDYIANTIGQLKEQLSLENYIGSAKIMQSNLNKTIEGMMGEHVARVREQADYNGDLAATLATMSNEKLDMLGLDSRILEKAKAIAAEETRIQMILKGNAILRQNNADMYEKMYGLERDQIVGSNNQERYDVILDQMKKVGEMFEYDASKGTLAEFFKTDAAAAAELERQLANILPKFDAYIAKAERAKNDLGLGFSRGIQSYLEDITDYASQMEDLTKNAFSGMEDALVEFVTTGKASFGDLVQSILADLARLFVRQSIMAPLASALGLTQDGQAGSGGGFLGVVQGAANGIGGKNNIPGGEGFKNGVTNLFGELFGNITNLFSGFGDVLINIFSWIAKAITNLFSDASSSSGGGFLGFIGSLFHSGGVAGSGSVKKFVNPAVFSNAVRYHSGGIAGLAPNEVPAILKRGERVLNLDETRQFNNGMYTNGSVSNINYAPVTHIKIERSGPSGASEAAADEMLVKKIGREIDRRNKESQNELLIKSMRNGGVLREAARNGKN